MEGYYGRLDSIMSKEVKSYINAGMPRHTHTPRLVGEILTIWLVYGWPRASACESFFGQFSERWAHRDFTTVVFLDPYSVRGS